MSRLHIYWHGRSLLDATPGQHRQVPKNQSNFNRQVSETQSFRLASGHVGNANRMTHPFQAPARARRVVPLPQLLHRWINIEQVVPRPTERQSEPRWRRLLQPSPNPKSGKMPHCRHPGVLPFLLIFADDRNLLRSDEQQKEVAGSVCLRPCAPGEDAKQINGGEGFSRPHDFIALINAAISIVAKWKKYPRRHKEDDVIAVAHRPQYRRRSERIFAFGRIGPQQRLAQRDR